MLQNDGGLGGYLSSSYEVEGESVSIDMGRVFYDNLFNFIIIILITEIMAGIIIDKFADLRQAQERIEEDSSSRCFICGQSRDILEKYYGKNGFFRHV